MCRDEHRLAEAVSALVLPHVASFEAQKLMNTRVSKE